MKSVPTIEKYMTTAPHTIGSEQSLAKAEKMMADLRIRHLPVLNAGKLVGILSDRDVKLVESFKDVNPEEVKISEAFTPDVYMVSPKAPLGEVCAEMALHKYGSVLVVDNHKLVGIFTWVDALEAFNELLDTRLKQ
ncbi:CBS domain-containing protein [Bdellovibrio svalbardensis]|uniref:CBS domain-containing protein n=1 Tax=Bdellovibrio svalbardensis TaxID=2972972 RepID=A0ABT6DHK2_9BACT|nr:CBS domain-containing protein [Bdellovibrio svalbardensis]MDG0816330.1 CBS domain-containing protein [Bdellovibrio svalbardensis]